jgi:methyl-accepting chemotaxis protein
MDAARKDAQQSARALAEQAAAGKELEIASRRVATLAAEMTNASGEQSKALASIARSADETRRIARQSARSLEEQSDALSSLAETTSRQSAAAAGVTKANHEQTAAGAQIARAIEDMRVQVRETVNASSAQTRGAQAFRGEMQELSALIARTRASDLADSNPEPSSSSGPP